MVSKEISFHILMQYPGFKEAVENNNTAFLKSVLHQMGIDVSLPYDIVSCEHRPYPNKPMSWSGPRVEGTERCDDAWLKSEYASWEVKVEATADPELRAQLKEMGRTGCADRTWSSDAVARSVAKQEKMKK